MTATATATATPDRSDTVPPRDLWLRRLRVALLLAFWICLLFFPYLPAASGVLSALAMAAAAVSVALVVSAQSSAPQAAARVPASVLVRAFINVWPYALYVLVLTIAWLAHVADASTQEYLRQWCFLATVLAVAEGGREEATRWVAAVIVGLALIVGQILGPYSAPDALGRPLHYPSIQQWSGYPEIGLLASLGAVACLALVFADRRWRVRLAGLLLAIGFSAATVYVMSRFSLVTIVITGVWMAIVAAVALRSRLALVALAVGAIAAGGLMLRADVGARLRAVFVDRTAAVEIRSEGWRLAEAMLHDHPWLGVGPGRFQEESAAYSGSGARPHAYNLVLHEGAELGYLGLAAYLALWARVLWRTLRTLRAVGRSLAGAATLAAHGMLVAFFVRSQSEHFLANLDASYRLLLLLAFLFGLGEGLTCRTIGRSILVHGRQPARDVPDASHERRPPADQRVHR